MGVGSTRDNIETVPSEAICQYTRIVENRLGIGGKFRPECLAKRHCFGGDDMRERAALQAREDRRIDLLCQALVVGQDQTTARAAQSLVSSGGDDMGMR